MRCQMTNTQATLLFAEAITQMHRDSNNDPLGHGDLYIEIAHHRIAIDDIMLHVKGDGIGSDKRIVKTRQRTVAAPTAA